MPQISIVYDSSFRGQTAALAKSVAKGAGSVANAEVHLFHVDDVDENWPTLHASDAILFGSPTYMGNVSGQFKIFMDKLAGEIWLKRMWKNKFAAGFTCSAGRSGDKLNSLVQMVICASQLGMMWVPQTVLGGNYSSEGSESDLNRLAGYLGTMAQANIDEPADVSPPPSDHETAEIHGRHVAQVAAQYNAGRDVLPIEDEAAYVCTDDDEGRPLGIKDLMG